MIASAHVAAGAVASMVAVTVARQPVARILIAITLALATHMAMDAIPHSEYQFLRSGLIVRAALIESIVACVIAALIVRRRLPPGAVLVLAAGIFASLLPDIQFGGDLFLPRHGAATAERIGDFFHVFHTRKHGSIRIEATLMVLLFASLTLFPKRPTVVQPVAS